MARYKVNQRSEYPYHITGRRTNRDNFQLHLDDVWKIFEDDLTMAHLKHGFKIYSFVLMPNHYHLIGQLTHTAIGPIMSEMLTSVSKEVNRRSGRINQTFGGRHYKCEIISYHHLVNCYKYVYQNPLRAGLCRRAEEWPYSTLHGLLGQRKLCIPLEPDSVLFNPYFDERELAWINTPIQPDHLDDFRSALEKKRFRLPRQQVYAPRHPLEICRI